jgi:dTDP-glucose 4,6-dehydratase
MLPARKLSAVLITGGTGFVGSNFIRFLFNAPDFTGIIINTGTLKNRGSAENLADIQTQYGGSRYFFEQGNIVDASFVKSVFSKYPIDTVVHFAAESHIDRSIQWPAAAIGNNILGTLTLLEAACEIWQGKLDQGKADIEENQVLFHHISTDEVYGTFEASEGSFTEKTAYNPRSPYAASKAASDLLAMAYHHTYGFPCTVSNCSNNYGPYQFPEKLIPIMMYNILEGESLPVYGNGKNIQNWIHLDDHSRALLLILRHSIPGQKYNIGGKTELTNISLLQKLIAINAAKNGQKENDITARITYVPDRPGNNLRCTIDCTKIKEDLGWEPIVDFEEGINKTVEWYINHREWMNKVKKRV